MKKQGLIDSHGQGIVKKWRRIMRITIVLIFGLMFTANANSYSQGSKLDIRMTDRIIRDVIAYVEDNSEFTFLYKNEDLNVDKKVSLNLKAATINQILDKVLDGEGVVYDVYDRQIIIRKADKALTYSQQPQQKTVTGVVTDQQGLPLPGVSVVVKGTTVGTVTNPDGGFTLSVPSNAETLQFSFVGMKMQEVAIEGRSTFTVVMEEETIGLEEVVAIGYGTIKKSDLTGSVQRVNVENYKTQSMVQVTDMLAGTVAGFNANQGTSAQGGASMEIRGPTSLTANTNPLIVLDGVIYSGTLRDINPYDIESVDILKDASSAAVFGSKAASGVVIITTTKGRTGKPTINFSTKMGLTENYNERRGLGPEEYIQFRQDYFRQMFPKINYNFFEIGT